MKKTLAVLVAASVAMTVFAALPADAKKKKKKPKACAALAVGEIGADAETLVVTDAATAEEPATFDFEFEPHFFEGLVGDAPTQPLNVQVDSAAATAGLYVTLEFEPRRDYDLWAFYADDSEAASSHGFSPLIETQGTPADQSNTASNHAGETKVDSENLVGVITPDCGGYTIRADNYFGEGGAMQLKIWLGEGMTEPKAPGAEE